METSADDCPGGASELGGVATGCVEFHPPHPPEFGGLRASVFSAGSIEMGKAREWQREFVCALKDLEVAVLNPRRPDWDPTWKQRMENPEFKAQVDWEMYWLEHVDVIALYLQADTVSPISLLELGVHAERSPGKVVICCEEGFGKLGNVEIVAARYNLFLVNEFDEMVAEVRARLEKLLLERSSVFCCAS
jgi:hypothetical protein